MGGRVFVRVRVNGNVDVNQRGPLPILFSTPMALRLVLDQVENGGRSFGLACSKLEEAERPGRGRKTLEGGVALVDAALQLEMEGSVVSCVRVNCPGA